MRTTLLVCTDGSAYSEAACQYTAWFAKRLNAEVEAVYVSDLRQFELSIVTDLGGAIGIEPYQGVLSQLQQMEAQKASILEESTQLYFKGEGLAKQLHFHHTTGLLVDHLAAFEKQANPPTLIILGKRGENADYATEHLGATMERVVRASKSPCLVTPRTFKEIRRLVLAYDGGNSCQKALQFLLHLEVFKDIEIHVVTVDEGHSGDVACQHLEEATAVLQKGGLTPVCKILHGLAENTLSDYVESQGIDMLVMGAYGHSRIRYLIIGSTTTDLIRRCQVPVLLFR